MRWLLLSILLVCASTLSGCQSFELTPPANFVELHESEWSSFALRSVNADGVVLAVRELDNEPKGTTQFWTDAVRNRLRAIRGYALLEEKDVKARSGETGHQLKLGRDEGSQSYDYWVTLFVTDAHVLVVEAGGRRDEFGRVRQALESAIDGFTIR